MIGEAYFKLGEHGIPIRITSQWFRPNCSIIGYCPISARPWWVKLRLWWEGA